jgi:hypothetical protein
MVIAKDNEKNLAKALGDHLRKTHSHLQKWALRFQETISS